MKNPELVTAKKQFEHLRSLKNANGTDRNELSDYRKSKVRYKKLIKSEIQEVNQNHKSNILT